MQFEKTRIHFKSDFFAVVAVVVDAKAPQYLTGTASEITPSARPVIMRPAYNMARFFAKPIRSHPSSKGTAQSSMVPLRPNWSIDHPPTGPPNMAPSVTRDCKDEIGNKVVR